MKKFFILMFLITTPFAYAQIEDKEDVNFLISLGMGHITNTSLNTYRSYNFNLEAIYLADENWGFGTSYDYNTFNNEYFVNSIGIKGYYQSFTEFFNFFAGAGLQYNNVHHDVTAIEEHKRFDDSSQCATLSLEVGIGVKLNKLIWIIKYQDYYSLNKLTFENSYKKKTVYLDYAVLKTAFAITF